MWDNGNTHVKYLDVFPLKIGVGVRGKELRSRQGKPDSQARVLPPAGQVWLFLRCLLALPEPIVSSDAIQEIAQRRKEQTGACGLRHMRDRWRLYSKYI